MPPGPSYNQTAELAGIFRNASRHRHVVNIKRDQLTDRADIHEKAMARIDFDGCFRITKNDVIFISSQPKENDET